MVSRYSKVRPMSRIILAPAQTTATGVWASSCRSAEMSMVVSAPRCTPPMPPVAKMRMPARLARIMVVATVVAPVRPVATIMGRSRRLTFSTFSARHIRSMSASSKPTFSLPSMMAVVAGTAPPARTTCCTLWANSRFSGQGMPWERMVLSRATTGLPALTAASISGWIKR